MNPLISIIVPNYNHADFLERRLESIFNQSYSNIEVILLDDRSSDNSREILSKYINHPKVSHHVFNTTNTGNTFLQWHRGLKLAKGDFIWIAESDDYCDLNFIEDLIQPLLTDEQIFLSYSQSNKVNELNEVTGSWLDYTLNLDDKAFREKFIMEGNLFIEKFLIHKNVIPNASAVIFRHDKNILADYITIDNQLRYCGDWIFYFKALLNHKVAFNPKELNNFRYHSQSVIARALNADSKIRLLDLDILMRLKMREFLSNNKKSLHLGIGQINSRIIKEIKYTKALLLFENKEYLRGLGYFITIPEIFIEKNKYLRRIKRKMVSVLNTKNKS